MIDLNDLQVFERVAALSGFSEAARALGLPKSNVSRSVARLEAALGTRLFHRSTREVTLTAAGAALHDRARALVDGAAEALEYVGSLTQGPRGQIRVNVGVGFGLNVVAKQLPVFLRRFPDVEVILDLESRNADLVKEAVDVAVRFGPLPDSTLVATALGTMRRYLCAAPSYLELRDTPATLEELQQYDIIEMPGADGRPRAWTFSRSDEQIRLALHPRVAVNEALSIAELVLSGAGIGILSAYLCGPAIADGRLVRLLPQWSVPPLQVTLLFPSRRELSPAVRVFAEFLREISEPGASWLEDHVEGAPN